MSVNGNEEPAGGVCHQYSSVVTAIIPYLHTIKLQYILLGDYWECVWPDWLPVLTCVPSSVPPGNNIQDTFLIGSATDTKMEVCRMVYLALNKTHWRIFCTPLCDLWFSLWVGIFLTGRGIVNYVMKWACYCNTNTISITVTTQSLELLTSWAGWRVGRTGTISGQKRNFLDITTRPTVRAAYARDMVAICSRWSGRMKFCTSL